MKFGLGIPTCREGSPYPLGFATPTLLRESAKFGEAEGYYSLWGDDHLVSTPSQMAGLPQLPNYFEPFTTYAYLAAITSRIKLMTATMVPALREPVLFAKQVATVDQMSGGRLILGMGLGGQRDEFEALAANPKADRGRMLDEFVSALRQLLETQRGPFAGKYYRFGEVGMAPAPAQRPFPIYLSGQVEDAIQRAATVANGWIVSSSTPQQVTERRALLRATAERAGRDPDGIETCLFIHAAISTTEEGARAIWDASYETGQTTRPARPAAAAPASGASTGRRRVNLQGTPEMIAARLHEYRDAGVQHVGLVFHALSSDEFFEQARLFAQAVMPHFDRTPAKSP